jgi:autotransporter translocation and assembly factor TamB
VSRRRRSAIALAGLFIVLLAVAIIRIPLWSAAVVSQSLSSFFGRPTSVGSVHYRFFPFAAEIRDVRVAGATPEAPPFLEVPRISAAPSFRPLWERRLLLDVLEVEGPRMRVNAFREGGDDLPHIRTGGGPAGFQVRIGRLLIRGGEVLVDHQRVPLDLDLPGFEGQLREGAGRALTGRVAFGPGDVRFGDNPPLPLTTTMQLTVQGSRLTVSSGRLRAEGTDLAYRGALQIAPLRGEFAVAGPVDLDVLERHVMRTGFGLRGAARYDGVVRVERSRVNVRGRLEGAAGVFDGVPVPRYGGDVVWDERGVHLRGFAVDAFGGSATLDVGVPPSPGLARLSGDLRGMDAEALSRMVFGVGPAGLGASVSGPLALEWPRGRVRDLTGTLAFDLAPRADGRTPLTGRVEWRAVGGVQTVESADLRTPSTDARLKGRIERDERTDLAVDAESRDLAASDDLLVRIRQALGARDARKAGFTGAGSFRGRWLGTLSEPVFQGRFAGEDVGYLGVQWGRAEWAGSVTASDVRSHSLVLRRGPGELWVDGSTGTGAYGEEDAIDVSVRLRDWPAEDLVRALEWDVDVKGLVTGQAAVKGRRSAPDGTVHVTAAEGRYYGVAFADLDVRSVVAGGVTDVKAGRARVAGGAVSFHGTVTDDGIYDGAAEISALELGALLPAGAPDLRWGGTLSGQVVLQGTRERPRLQGRLRSPAVALGTETVGPVEARLQGSGDGTLAVEAECRAEGIDLAARGRVGLLAPYESEVDVQARNTRLDPLLRAAVKSLPPWVGVVVNGTAHVQGPLQAPRQMRAEAMVDRLALELPDYPVVNREPLRLAVEGGRLQLREIHLAGEGTDLTVEGSAGIVAEGAMNLEVRGTADLALVSLLGRDLRGQGAARVAVAVGGTRGAPQVDGTLAVEGGSVRLRGFPHGIDDVRGTVAFTQGGAHFSGVTGTVGGGPVELEGQAVYEGARLTTFDVHASGRSLALRYPEGLRSVVDVDLRFFGEPVRPWLTGTVDVRQASWTRRYDLATELLAEGRPAPDSASLGGGLRYDVKVSAPGTLRVDNNLATLQARAELGLQGTYDAPVVLGHAEVDRGRVYFQGNTYVIRRGTIDFTNPRKVDPLFDIEAETRVQTYRISLKMNGTLDRVYPTLTSDPPLAEYQILAVLAGAPPDEQELIDPTQRELAQRKLAAAGAATLFGGRLSEELGLERGASRLGLNRFSIDPAVTRGEGVRPAARVTVGKRITPDVNVVYSVDLSAAEDRIVTVEYTLSDRFSVVLSRADINGYGFDVRVRQTRR